MNQSYPSIKEIVDKMAICLNAVNISDTANDKVGGVSITSKQKSLIAALSVVTKAEDGTISEPLVLRKILEAILIGALVPVATQSPASFSNLSFNSPGIDSSRYVSRAEYDKLLKAYNEIFTQAGSENAVILSQEEYDSMRISDEQIEEIVYLAKEYDSETAVEVIKQFLFNEDTDEEDLSGGN